MGEAKTHVYLNLKSVIIYKHEDTEKNMLSPWQNSSWRFKAAGAQHYSSLTLKPPFQSLPSPVVIEQASRQFTQRLHIQQSSSFFLQSLSQVSASPSLSLPAAVVL